MSDLEMDGVDEEHNRMEEDDDMIDENETTENDANNKKDVYLPGKPIEEGEELVCDETAYVMLHQAQTGDPCLSFDVIKDELGDSRETFPAAMYVVSGTQASQAHVNNVIVMKFSNLHKTGRSEDEESEDDDDDPDESKRPQMSCALIRHQGCVNRIRCTKLNNTNLVATWSELGRVNIWDITKQLEAVNNPHILSLYNKEHFSNKVKPLFTFTGHQTEGFGIDWCPTVPGFLATGDCKRNIHIWRLTEAAKWDVDQRPLVGHTASVEDLQWSPTEASVLASCSVDRSIRIWDIRAPPSKACMLTNEKAHENDVNVISWNRNEPFIVSGGDDGFLHVWDLRQFKEKTAVATFKHHTEAVCSVEWHPTDSSVFASGGSDDQIALWDLAVEKDDGSTEDVEEVPPQLLFIHQGQKDIKELHWHPQIPGVIISTANSGFNIFKTISV